MSPRKTESQPAAGVLRRRHSLFAHWPASPAALHALTPPELGLDRFEGRPWLTLSACLLTQVPPWGRPQLAPRSTVMVSLNTYVGGPERRGLLWISQDVNRSRPALLARRAFAWPAHRAACSLEPSSGRLLVQSRRESAVAARFLAWYRGEPDRAREPSSELERFLFERSEAYGRRPSGSLVRTELSDREPWQLAPARAELSCAALLGAAGLPAPHAPAVVHFVARQDTLVSRPSTMVRATTRSGRAPRARCRTA